MLGALLILAIAIFLAFLEPILDKRRSSPKNERKKYDAQIKKLWTIAKDSMNSRKTLRAEKALLTILKLDETNAAAYNRLGILYAKAQNYDEAIECFEIAQSLDNNPMSLHNVGLIYLETGSYEKASMAFQQALKLENTVPARFLALAKAEEKLGHRKTAIEALESAFLLDKSTSTLRQILTIYEDADDRENIDITTSRIEQQIAEDALKKAEQEKTKKKEHRSSLPLATRSSHLSRPRPKILYPKTATPLKALKKATVKTLTKTEKIKNQKDLKLATSNIVQRSSKLTPANTRLRNKKLSSTASNAQILSNPKKPSTRHSHIIQ